VLIGRLACRLGSWATGVGQVGAVAVEEEVGTAAHERLEVAGIGAIAGHAAIVRLDPDTMTGL
jgi:hypothetical protein